MRHRYIHIPLLIYSIKEHHVPNISIQIEGPLNKKKLCFDAEKYKDAVTCRHSATAAGQICDCCHPHVNLSLLHFQPGTVQYTWV